MVVGVVVVSFVMPMAFSRYFVVLVPVVLPVLAVQFGALNLNRLCCGCEVGVLGLLLVSWWGPGFSELDPALRGVREQDQFRLISQRTGGLGERYGPRARLLNLSDQMEVAMGRIPSDPVPWCDADDLGNVWPHRPCLRSSGWPAVDLHRPWSASSNPCNHKLCRRVTTVNNVRKTSVMRGCCVADLKPWAVPSELSGSFAGAGQQQGAAGLRVHQ